MNIKGYNEAQHQFTCCYVVIKYVLRFPALISSNDLLSHLKSFNVGFDNIFLLQIEMNPIEDKYKNI